MQHFAGTAIKQNTTEQVMKQQEFISHDSEGRKV